MTIDSVEFDGLGHAESDLARIWCDAAQGERKRITKAASEVEDYLKEHPEAGNPLTNGVHPVVRYLDWDLLRVYYQIYESEKKIIIIGFRLLL